MMGKARGHDEPAVVSGHFVYGRTSRDQFWGYLYAVVLALTVIGGIYVAKNRYGVGDTPTRFRSIRIMHAAAGTLCLCSQFAISR